MGAPRKPAFIRKLEGNRSKTPIPDEVVGIGRPRAPEHLTPAQLERWHDIVQSLPAGLLSQADEQVLERMAIAWAAFREASAVVARSSLLVAGRDGNLVRNPMLVVRKHASEEMHVCGMLLGLSPVSRTRLTQPHGDGADDPLDLLMEPQWQRPQKPPANAN